MPRTPGEAADRVAAEVEQRIERLATLAADAILHSLYAPQVVMPPRAQSLDYWRPYFFTEDGYVNQPGRDLVVQQVGGAEYKQIADDLAREYRREGREVLEEEPPLETPPAPAPSQPAPVEPAREPVMPPLYGPRGHPAGSPIAA